MPVRGSPAPTTQSRVVAYAQGWNCGLLHRFTMLYWSASLACHLSLNFIGLWIPGKDGIQLLHGGVLADLHVGVFVLDLCD